MAKGSRSSSKTTSKAFNFNNVDYSGGESGGGGRLGKNINLAESSLKVGDVISTDHGAVTSAVELAKQTNSTGAQTLITLGDRAYDDVEDSRELTRDLFGGAVSSVTSANREALQFLGQGTKRALAFAQKSTRSESGQIAENLTKYMMIGGAGIVALVFITRR